MKLEDILVVVAAIILIILSWISVYLISEYFLGHNIAIYILLINSILGLIMGYSLGIRVFDGGESIPLFMLIGSIFGFIGVIIAILFFELYEYMTTGNEGIND